MRESIKHVHLTAPEVEEARQNATDRRRNARSQGAHDATVMHDRFEQAEFEGCLGEKAVSKLLGQAWNKRMFSRQEYKDKSSRGNDVGEFEVRATTYSHGRLILQPGDADEAIFILVLLDAAPTFAECSAIGGSRSGDAKVVGWLSGSDGKQRRWWDTNVRRPCYMVPQQELQSMAKLLRRIELKELEERFP